MGHPSDLNLQLFDVATDLSFQNGQWLFDQKNLTGPKQNEPAKVSELGLMMLLALRAENQLVYLAETGLQTMSSLHCLLQKESNFKLQWLRWKKNNVYLRL